MSVVKSHKLALMRQAHEAVLILRFEGHELLNRKGEWGSNLPPALIIEGEESDRDRPVLPTRKRRRMEYGDSDRYENIAPLTETESLELGEQVSVREEDHLCQILPLPL